MIKPLYKEISYQEPVQLFAAFAQTSGSIFLDSAQLRLACGRYSFIAVDPFLMLTSKNGEIRLNNAIYFADPFEVLRTQLALFPLEYHLDLPPFQGGVAGFFSYDLHQHLEEISISSSDDMQFADLAVGFYDVVIAFDNEEKRAWIFSSGYPEQVAQHREQRAHERCVEWEEKLIFKTDIAIKNGVDEKNITANFSQEEYQQAVVKVKEYILAGDIFEANISQRFHVDVASDFVPFELYKNLRAINPAPFAAYLCLHDTVIASASPERFLKLTRQHVESRPIKGTRPRGKTLQQDKDFALELTKSEKDHAENVMIVDLMRNDLSRVCEDHSVKVPQLCGLESYATVHHLVSVVTGKLASEYDAIDLLRATFPGGSITGAPKIRAMEIIAEIEPTKRGPYCGSIGYIGFNGDMDTSITIRTFAIKNNRVCFQAGGAVVMDSDPLAEYEETLTKVRALKNALEST